MVTLSLIDSELVVTIILLVLSLGLSFLSLKIGAFGWFITSFAWVGLAIYLGDDWGGVVSSIMALFCQVLFILTASKKRGR